MALNVQPRVVTTRLMDRENAKVVGVTGKPVQRTQRQALTNITNKTTGLGGKLVRDVKKPAFVKPVVQKTNKVVLRPAKLEATQPMDISLDKGTSKVTAPAPKKAEIINIKSGVLDIVKPESKPVAFSDTRWAADEIDDVDVDDMDNPQLVAEYVKDIYKYLRQVEEEQSIRSKFLSGTEITGKHRKILIDWLILVHLRCSLLQETLYLTVAILDQFLQVDRTTRKDTLQLVGVTATFIASKYEEMYLPEITDFVYLCDNVFKVKEIKQMEIKILSTLNFNLGRPLPLHFLRRNSKVGSADSEQHTLAKYIMELTLPEYNFAHINPSVMAASSLCLSCAVLAGRSDAEGSWTPTLQHYSGYTYTDLHATLCSLAALIVEVYTSSKKKENNVVKKYASKKFSRISLLTELNATNALLTKLASKAVPH